MKRICRLSPGFLILLFCSFLPGCGPDYETYLEQGQVSANNREYDKAIAEFTRAIELKPRTAEAYRGRGMAHTQKDRLDDALSDFNTALELDPDDGWTYGARGLVFYSWGDHRRAISDFSTAIKINPGFVDAYNNKAWLLATCPDASLRNGDIAVELAQKALEIDRDFRFLDTLAAAYAETGKFDEAIRIQLEVIDILKKDARSASHLDRAVEHLESYKSHKPWRESKGQNID